MHLQEVTLSHTQSGYYEQIFDIGAGLDEYVLQNDSSVGISGLSSAYPDGYDIIVYLGSENSVSGNVSIQGGDSYSFQTDTSIHPTV